MAVGLACFRYRWHGHVVLVPCFLLFLLDAAGHVMQVG